MCADSWGAAAHPEKEQAEDTHTTQMRLTAVRLKAETGLNGNVLHGSMLMWFRKTKLMKGTEQKLPGVGVRRGDHKEIVRGPGGWGGIVTVT